MEHVAAFVAGELDEDLDRAVPGEVDGVFPAGVGGVGRVAAAAEDLEVPEVRMDGVADPAGAEAPQLDGAELRARGVLAEGEASCLDGLPCIEGFEVS